MTGTATDYDEIVRVVQLYIDACNEYDNDKMNEAFYEDAWMFFTDAEGVLHKGFIGNRAYWDGANQEPERNILGRIISVIQAGDVAGVLLGWDNVADPSNSWVDFHSLLRIDGVWKIMNKTATHHSRAAWAGALASQSQDTARATAVGQRV